MANSPERETASRKLQGASETDLNKSSILTHDYETQSTQSDPIFHYQTGLTDRNFWVTHQFQLCLDLGLINRQSTIDNRQSIIPERQTKRFGIQLRITKLQINKLALPDCTSDLCSGILLGKNMEQLPSIHLLLIVRTRRGTTTSIAMQRCSCPHSFTDHSSAQPCSQQLVFC